MYEHSYLLCSAAFSRLPTVSYICSCPRSFPWDSQAPSVRQVLLWLALLANQPEYKMPAQGLSYKPVAVGGSGGGQGSGTSSPASSSRPPVRPPGGQAPSGSAPPHQGALGHTSRAVAEFGELEAIGSGESGTVYAGRQVWWQGSLKL